VSNHSIGPSNPSHQTSARVAQIALDDLPIFADDRNMPVNADRLRHDLLCQARRSTTSMAIAGVQDFDLWFL